MEETRDKYGTYSEKMKHKKQCGKGQGETCSTQDTPTKKRTVSCKVTR